MSRSFVRPAFVVVSLLALLLPFWPACAQPAEQRLIPRDDPREALQIQRVQTYINPYNRVCVGDVWCTFVSDPTPAPYTTVTVYGQCTSASAACAYDPAHFPITISATWCQ